MARKDTHPLDNGIERVVALLQRTQPGPGAGLPELRAWIDSLGAVLPIPPDVEVTRLDAGEVAVLRVTAPGAASDQAVLYLHGGAYVAGSFASHGGLAAALSRASGAAVYFVEYRLAPEHVFPAALDDALAAYRWLLRHGLAPHRTALAGDSAGGGLAVATLLTLRDAGDPLPAAAVGFSPWTDLKLTGESIVTKAAEDPVVTPEAARLGAALYAGATALDHPHVSPFYADLTGLPPLLVLVGHREIMLDDARRFTVRARDHKVAITIQEWPGMIHVWPMYSSMVPEGYRALDASGAFLRAHVAAG